jgi:hypothetical protein
VTVLRIDPVDTSQITNTVATQILGTDAPPNLSLMTPVAGSQSKAARSDHTHPVRVQRFRVACAADGTATWTFATPFAQVPAVTYMLENTADQPMIANITELDTNHVRVKLFMANKLPATLGLLSGLVNFNIFGVSNSVIAGTMVNLVAAEPTQ